ncbi:unnamed protein product [Brugia timori]|nr:unnamed protein product [Brugia timori]
MHGDCDYQMPSPSSPLEYRPTPHFILIIVFVILPFIYLCGRLVVTSCFVLVFVLKSMFSPVLQLLYRKELIPIQQIPRYVPQMRIVREAQVEQFSDEQLTDESDKEHEVGNTSAVKITDDFIKRKSKSSTNVQTIHSSRLEIQTGLLLRSLHDSEHDSGNDEDHSALSASSAATTSTNQNLDISEAESIQNPGDHKEKMQCRHRDIAFQLNDV